MLSALLLVTACWLGGGMEATYDLDEYEFNAVEISTGSGYIDITAGNDLELEAEFHNTEDEAMLRKELIGDVLVITSDCATQLCSIDLDLVIPAGVEVIARTASGDIDVQEMEGGAFLETADGMVSVIDLEGGLDVITVGGDVDLLDIDCDVQVTTVDGSVDGSDMALDFLAVSSTNGKVMLDLKQAPQEVVIDTISSGIDLTVPVDEYDLTLESLSGTVSTYNLDDSDGAARIITAHSTSGSISVTGD